MSEDRVALEALAEAPTLAFGEALGGLQRSVSSAVELGVAAVQASAAASALGAPARLPALALAAERVERAVRAADEVEVIADDPRVGQLGADRLAVGLRGVDRDDLDRRALLDAQRAQVALNRPPGAAVDDVDDAARIEVGHDRRELAGATMVRLVERQPPRQRRFLAS